MWENRLPRLSGLRFTAPPPPRAALRPPTATYRRRSGQGILKHVYCGPRGEVTNPRSGGKMWHFGPGSWNSLVSFGNVFLPQVGWRNERKGTNFLVMDQNVTWPKLNFLCWSIGNTAVYASTRFDKKTRSRWCQNRFYFRDSLGRLIGMYV